MHTSPADTNHGYWCQVLQDLQVNCEELKAEIIVLKSKDKSKQTASKKKPRGPGRSDRDKEEAALMQAAKQFGFEKCPFLGYGYEASLKEDPDALEDDQDPLEPNATPQIPLKSLSLAYRAYLPLSFRESASDELLAGKVRS